jgi:hypothetical protein
VALLAQMGVGRRRPSRRPGARRSQRWRSGGRGGPGVLSAACARGGSAGCHPGRFKWRWALSVVGCGARGVAGVGAGAGAGAGTTATSRLPARRAFKTKHLVLVLEALSTTSSAAATIAAIAVLPAVYIQRQ